MKNRIALIRPPTINRGTSFIATQFPLNLAGIAARLRKEGYAIEIWDFDVEKYGAEILQQRLKIFAPSIVGISCYTPTAINGHAIAAAVKSFSPDTVTVIGGPHVSALPEATMDEFAGFDIGVLGEGEETVVELARKMIVDGGSPEEIKGIIYRSGGVLRKTEKRPPIADLDSLPFPARDLLNMDRYKSQSHRGFSRSFLKITEIMTSRGCPNRCTFCASDVVMGKGVRFRSAVSVNEEIKECAERYGFNHFCISDDTFTLREERLYEICETFERMKLSWNCNARVWPISRKMLSAMARSGCTGITFGVESGSPRILKLIRKNITIEQIENAFRWAEEEGIKLVEADVIIGSHPSETIEDVRLTERLLRRISPDIAMVSVIVPYPGTEVYRVMKEKRLIFAERAWDSFVLFGKEPSWRTENFSPKKLVAIQKKIIRDFYFRPSFMLRIFGKMRSFGEFAYWVRGGFDFIFDFLKSGLNSLRTRLARR